MSVITFPTTLNVSRSSWGQVRRDMLFTSLFSSQSVGISDPLWSATLQSDRNSIDAALVGQWKSTLMQLRGRQNQLALWDLGRTAPIGTMRGSMTLSGAHTRGTTALVIAATGQNTLTLKAGDLLGLGSGLTQQVVMVTADATANASGITVTIEPPLRNDFVTAAAVTWDKPCVLFRVNNPSLKWDYENMFALGFSLDLIEDWRP